VINQSLQLIVEIVRLFDPLEEGCPPVLNSLLFQLLLLEGFLGFQCLLVLLVLHSLNSFFVLQLLRFSLFDL
jgi:hypothetical protein